MATLVLGTVGRAVGGPVGGLIGSFVGSTLDRSLLGGKGRDVGRLANLAVQSSAYGEPIPRLYGTMRVAGNLVWTAGIAETASPSGGKGGPATTGYSYTASFAVLLSARRIERVGRVWADGKLLRDAAGAWLSPVTMRVHDGSDGQAADPLILAAEGVGGAPAYRGIAYAVFEDLPLADYGNRIPNLTFEVVADEGTDAGAVVADLAGASSVSASAFPGFGGFAAARSGSIRAQLGQLTELYDLRFIDDGRALVVRAGPDPAVAALADADFGSHAASASVHEARGELRGAAGQFDDAVAIAFHDPSRDYQPGLQRAARRADVVRVAQVDIAAAFAAETAKGLAADLLARRSAARTGATLNLPVRGGLGIRAGASVQREGARWTVRQWSFSNFVAELTVERRPGRGLAPAAADAGRAHDAGDAAAGPTQLHILDLPPLFGDGTGPARIWVAGAGASPRWRRSGVALSLDEGETYAAAGEIGAASVIGTLTAPLEAGSGDRWDRVSQVEVELLAETMWLEGRSEGAVLGGANLAVVGDEVVQFAVAAALGGRRFALTTLLRGRRGSAVAAHPAGTRFVLLDAARLLAVEPGVAAVGGTLRLRPTGSGDLTTSPTAFAFNGNAGRPLPPVLLRAAAEAGDTVFTWVRRSRAGYGWADAVQVPLGEANERYRVELAVAGVTVRAETVAAPAWRYLAAARSADGAGPGTVVTLTITQLGDLAGNPARAAFVLS